MSCVLCDDKFYPYSLESVVDEGACEGLVIVTLMGAIWSEQWGIILSFGWIVLMSHFSEFTINTHARTDIYVYEILSV